MDIRKVRKRQHQYPEFGHKQGEILEKPAENHISIQRGGEMVPEFHPVFLFC
jgi:hypothetical protein